MSDRPCQSCGRRGVLLVEVTFRDDAAFEVCVPCANEATENGCSVAEVEQ